MDNTRETLINLIEPVCNDSGYDLVDVQYKREQQGWVVRVFIDLAAQVTEVAHSSANDVDVPGDASEDASKKKHGVSFGDCEILSREVSAIFDVEDPIAHAYRLEVSSPGIDRPLRTVEHFRRFVGENAKVALSKSSDCLKGRRRFTGTLIEVKTKTDIEVVTILVDGERFDLPVCDVASANLVPDWDKLMTEVR